MRFAGLYPRNTGFRVGFAQRRWLRHPRIVKTANYGPRRRGHFVDIRSESDLDNELRAWLQESHDTVGVQDDIIQPPTPHNRKGADVDDRTGMIKEATQVIALERPKLKA